MPRLSVMLAAAAATAPAAIATAPAAADPGPAATGARAPALTLNVRNAERFVLERTRLRGRLSGAADVARRRVVLESDPWPFDAFRAVKSKRTGREGRFRFTVRPRRNTRHRVLFRTVASPELRLWADWPSPTRVFDRGGDNPRIRLKLFSFPNADVRDRVPHGYVAKRGETVWRLVTSRPFQRFRGARATVTLRFPAGTLRRRDHWLICLPEPVPDAFGLAWPEEQRCGQPTMPLVMPPVGYPPG
jgi:hypothetical protein